MIEKSTAVVVSISVIALVTAAALKVPAEGITAIAAACVAIAGAMRKLYTPKDEDQ